jgi:hypothetical protein
VNNDFPSASFSCRGIFFEKTSKIVFLKNQENQRKMAKIEIIKLKSDFFEKSG